MKKRLTEEQYLQFHDEGYVMVPDLFLDSDLEPLRQEIAQIIDSTVATLATEGKIGDTHAGEGFYTRLTRLLADNPDLAGTFFGAIEGKGGGGNTSKALFRMLTHPNLLDAMEDLIGPEIVASSVYRIRPKVPHLGRGVVPWHQDSGYISKRCDDDLIVTCWIPLVDANGDNGCLQVIPRAHLGPVVRHHTGGNAGFLVITNEDLPTVSVPVTVPVPAGGALLMTNRTPHCSTPNNTDTIRWSIDLRYQGEEVPNNLSVPTEDVSADHPDINIACYAPEGDFIVRSQKDPSRVFDHARFVTHRQAFERTPIRGEGRGWQPVATYDS
jgi:phytanoyl-CoA hydroxylase